MDHAACVASVVDCLIADDLSEAVLLGHSYSGTIIARVFEAGRD